MLLYRKDVTLVLVICCLISLITAARAQTKEANVQPAFAAKKVTLEAERIPLYQVIEKLAVTSGMKLTTDLTDAASATPMAVYIRDIPFSDVADALASCLSQRRAAWRWVAADDKDSNEVAPEEMKPGVTYRLRCSAAARNYAARARARILNDLAAEAQNVAAEAESAVSRNADPGDKTASTDLPSLDNAGRPAPPTIDDRAARRGVAAFFAHLNAAERDRILEGATIEGRLDRLDPAQAAAIEAYARQRNEQQESAVAGRASEAAIGANESAHFFAGASLRRDGRRITPILGIYSGIVVRQTGGGGGYSSQFPLIAVGEDKLRTRWSATLIREWTPLETETNEELTLPGMSDSAPAPEMLAKTPPSVIVFTEESGDNSGPIKDDLTDSLERLHRATNLPIIARLPLLRGTQTGLMAPRNDRTLGGFRADLRDTLTTATRWHRRILLANPLNAIWETAPEYLCPPAFLSALRRERDKDALNCLSFETLCAASRLTPEALRSLSEEFPVMEDLTRWRPFLNFLATNAALRRPIQQEPGLPVEENPALEKVYRESGREPGSSHLVEDIFLEELRAKPAPFQPGHAS